MLSRRALKPIADFGRAMWHDTRHDLLLTSWSHALYGAGIFIWVVGLLCLLVILGFSTIYNHNSLLRSGSYCMPDGNFEVNPARYSYWRWSGFFQITLPFGELSFSQAKVIDVVWDVLFGRGGQAIITVFSWRVFTLYVTTSMETNPITYGSFRTIFLERSPALLSTTQIIRDFLVRKALHSKLAMYFIATTMIFALAFPTMAGAMTGYTQSLNPFVPNHENSNLVHFDQFDRVKYVIHDGQRVGLTTEYNVTESMARSEDKAMVSLADECLAYYRASNDDHPPESSTFLGHRVGPPRLDISFSPGIWRWSNQSYDMNYVTTAGTCQPITTYQWGFSFIQLFIMNILILLWTVGILILWGHTRGIMRERGRRKKTVAGENKAVIDLAAAMHKELGANGPILETSTEHEMKSHIADIKGGRISYILPINLRERGPRKIRFLNWLKREKWWLAATCVSVAITTCAGTYSFRLFPAMVGPICGLVSSLAFGSTIPSRTVLILLWTILSAIMAVVPYK